MQSFHTIQLTENRKIYFLSDLHLGAPDEEKSRLREQKVLRFLNQAEKDAQAIFLVGDVFDFWFEYTHAVPKGYVRFLAKLADLKEKGIAVYMFAGNHDLWLKDYLYLETGVQIYHDRQLFRVLDENGRHTDIFVAHGDGLGPGDTKYKILKKIFTHPVCQWMFRWLHPDIGIKIAQLWSRHSFTDPALEVFHGEEREWLIQYCKRKMKEISCHYFIMGHRHLPMEIPLNNDSTYINLGDWIVNSHYAVCDGDKITLLHYQE